MLKMPLEEVNVVSLEEVAKQAVNAFQHSDDFEQILKECQSYNLYRMVDKVIDALGKMVPLGELTRLPIFKEHFGWRALGLPLHEYLGIPDPGIESEESEEEEEDDTPEGKSAPCESL